MLTLFLLAFFWSCQIFYVTSQSILRVNLTNIGYNYALPMHVSDLDMKLIVDTGNHDMTIQQYDSTIGPRVYNSVACMSLYEDSTYIYYFSENSSYTGYCNTAVNQRYVLFLSVGTITMAMTIASILTEFLFSSTAYSTLYIHPLHIPFAPFPLSLVQCIYRRYVF